MRQDCVNDTRRDFSTTSFTDVLFNSELRKPQWPIVSHYEWKILVMAIKPVWRHAQLRRCLVDFQEPVSARTHVWFDLDASCVKLMSI
jgi:hypothetical protein